MTDFVVSVLRDIVPPHRASAPPPPKETEAYSEEELKLVKDRLRSLGYLPEE